MRLTRKEARRLGIKDEAPRVERSPVVHTPGSYAWAGAQGWMLATTGIRGELVYAWRANGPRLWRTADYPAGAGDDLGSHYRAACAAIARGEYAEVLP
jgi:hypothetical protein